MAKKGIFKGVSNATMKFKKMGFNIVGRLGNTGRGVQKAASGKIINGVRNTGRSVLGMVTNTGRGVFGAAGNIGKGALNTVNNVGNKALGYKKNKTRRRRR